MEINNFSIFNTDNKCYRPKSSLLNQEDLNKFVKDNFNSYQFEIKKNSENKSLVEECKNKALEENKSVFIISDLSRNRKGNNFYYNCLIPKADKLCDFDDIENLLKPFNDLINDLFGSKLERTPTSITSELPLNEETRNKDFRSLNECFSFTENGKRNNFSKSGNFIIYKTELIDNDNLRDSLARVQPYNYYKNEYTNWIQLTEGVLNNFEEKFKIFICNPNRNNEDELDKSILRLQEHYTKIFSSLDSITLDISNLAVLTKYDTLYLEKLQKMIDEKKEELKSLIGFDGANNGKLDDTKFLKNLKISENIILFFVIAFVIYAYAKKQI